MGLYETLDYLKKVLIFCEIEVLRQTKVEKVLQIRHIHYDGIKTGNHLILKFCFRMDFLHFFCQKNVSGGGGNSSNGIIKIIDIIKIRDFIFAHIIQVEESLETSFLFVFTQSFKCCEMFERGEKFPVFRRNKHQS